MEEKILYVVGIGPGDREDMTIRADRILQSCEVIAGYPVYTDLIKACYPQAAYITTPMRAEKERCLLALEAAAQGKRTALVSSGDSGIYGLCGLALLLSEQFPGVQVRGISGVTAASSGGALLGAPLGHDFAVISLSDLLTPKDVIEARLRAAAASDLILCLYNPESRRRAGYLAWACRILLEYKPEDTVCGLARNIGRDGESSRILTLGQLSETPADMFTTVFVGNRETVSRDGKMITPRGYRDV